MTRSTLEPERGAVAPASASDDAEAIARVRAAIAGEEGAFDRLYREQVQRVHRFLLFRVSDPVAARDLTQDVFLRALRGIRRLRRPERFEPWLLRIAHRAVQNHYRGRGRRPEEVELDHVERAQERDRADLGEGRATAPRDPDAWLERAERLDELRAAMADLSEAQREVLALRFVAGLSLAETAEATGRSGHAVRKLQYRGLAELRRRLGVGIEEDGP